MRALHRDQAHTALLTGQGAQTGDALSAAVLRQRDAQIEALTAERAVLQAHCTALAEAAKDGEPIVTMDLSPLARP